MSYLFKVCLIFLCILSISCKKYLDLAFDSSVDGEPVIVSRFPIGVNDKDARGAILNCKYASWIYDSNCTHSPEKTICEHTEPVKQPSYCIVNGVKIQTE